MTVNLPPINREAPFQTRSIQPSDYPKIAEIARCWKKIAEEKRSQTTKGDEQEQFQSCANVSCWISGEILCDKYMSGIETYGCMDAKGHIQGLIMLIQREEGIYIERLVANPIHIRSPVNEGEIGRMRGVGTHLLKIAEDLACQKKKEKILVTPIDSSIPFYLKNGFVHLPDSPFTDSPFTDSPFTNYSFMSKTVEETSQKTRSIFERLVA